MAASDAARLFQRFQKGLGLGLCVRAILLLANGLHHAILLLRGDIIVVPTGDQWWRILRPGFAITSDDAPAEDVVWATLESGM